MKKKILGGVAALAIAAVVAFNISLNTKKDNASLLALANVEALASEANGYTNIGYYFCGVGKLTNDPTEAVYGLYCGSCVMDAFVKKGSGYCKTY